MAIATINPTMGLTEAEFAPHDAEETNARIAQAHAAHLALRGTDFATRAGWMRAAADILEGEVEPVARMITVEMGKPIAQSRAEVLKCVKNMRFYAEHAEEFLADEPLDEPATVGASAAFARYEPLGVVLAVMPWNYPLWQVIRFAAPALMAGNTGVLKHASNVPQAALYLDTLFSRGGFPDGSFRTLLIGSGAVSDVIADRRVRAVTLTGSEPAGRSVAATAGQHIKKTVLELGGSDPFIVLPSADVAAAARMAGLVVGDPLDEATEIGPLATASGRDELAALVEDAVAKGATLRVGGSIPDREGWFYNPTVVEGVTPAMRLYLEEAFGPVASLYRVNDVEEALELANATTFGLSSAVWTRDPDEERRALAGLEAGAVFVNGMTVSYPELPFGGIKDSGYGRELAASGIREFCNLKTVWKA